MIMKVDNTNGTDEFNIFNMVLHHLCKSLTQTHRTPTNCLQRLSRNTPACSGCSTTQHAQATRPRLLLLLSFCVWLRWERNCSQGEWLTQLQCSCNAVEGVYICDVPQLSTSPCTRTKVSSNNWLTCTAQPCCTLHSGGFASESVT